MSERPVATDALETLGTIIDDKQKRDAIHLAVEPVIAGMRLRPGEHITVINGVAKAADKDEGALGIVDPFLMRNVREGERFWFVMYPRMVHSLRHVWTHPAFADEPGVSASQPATPSWTKADSEKWLREFIDHADCPAYEEVMDSIQHGGLNEHSLHMGDSARGEIPPEFWRHAEIVLGRNLQYHPTMFSCSC